MAKVHKVGEWLQWHCLGCGCGHRANVEPVPEKPKPWRWNRSLEAPTLQPSVNYPGVCHFWMKEGKIEFLADCKHALAGQTVEMEEI